jgi:hypothetical protein
MGFGFRLKRSRGAMGEYPPETPGGSGYADGEYAGGFGFSAPTRLRIPLSGRPGRSTIGWEGKIW